MYTYRALPLSKQTAEDRGRTSDTAQPFFTSDADVHFTNTKISSDFSSSGIVFKKNTSISRKTRGLSENYSGTVFLNKTKLFFFFLAEKGGLLGTNRCTRKK